MSFLLIVNQDVDGDYKNTGTNFKVHFRKLEMTEAY